ncbi:MAG: EF-P beta-lysylation protein EpmB [Gammaproteobacteria bacterium]|nr:EF-P beta-lysylation protein EpmB [Gammaproteobacteria bacterium]
MIARQPPLWQRALAEAVTEPAELRALLGLGHDPGAESAATLFPLRVPRGFVARMRPNDPNDPLLRQVLPVEAECDSQVLFSTDPLGELGLRGGDGVLQKYHGRALLIATGACAVHCRYCFRRHFPYAGENAAAGNWGAALAHLRRAPDIREVILSGGDPLSLADHKLARLADALDSIAHVQRLRIHTRQPIVLPERVDDELVVWLSRLRMRKLVVVHCNHANEIDSTVRRALRKLSACGATLLNQSVLLRGVNDSTGALVDLSEALFAAGVLPYYLHLLDPVQGAAHFDVPEARARAIMRAVTARLPGYLVPRLAREEAGRPAKTVLPVTNGRCT